MYDDAILKCEPQKSGSILSESAFSSPAFRHYPKRRKYLPPRLVALAPPQNGLLTDCINECAQITITRIGKANQGEIGTSNSPGKCVPQNVSFRSKHQIADTLSDTLQIWDQNKAMGSLVRVQYRAPDFRPLWAVFHAHFAVFFHLLTLSRKACFLIFFRGCSYFVKSLDNRF